MESDAHSAFEHNFSARIRNQAQVHPPTHPLSHASSQAPFETAAFATAPDPVFSSIQRLPNRVQQIWADQVTILRLAGHLSVLVVAAVILLLSQLKLPAWNLPTSTLWQDIQQNAGVAHSERKRVTTNLTPQEASLQRAVIPNTLITKRPAGARQAIEVYTVKSGDTVLAIAAKYGINPETILWANPAIEQDPDTLAIDDQLNILPLNGVLHVVKPGDTLASLASQYKVTVDIIIGYPSNQLTNATAPLAVGRSLVIPDGVKEFSQPQYAVAATDATPANANIGGGHFVWPVGGDISQAYWGGHPALDISSWTGNVVKAPDSGYVALASSGDNWNTGYGNYIIIDHGNGFTTLYAHLSSIFVKQGENVTRGEQIAMIGTTGRSTGPHLHFEIRYQGMQRNPATYLP